MESESFYIYLNSSASKKEFKYNDSAAFTNIISPCLTLNSHYEVAVHDIIFRPKFHRIRKDDPEYYISLLIEEEKEGEALVQHSIVKYIPHVDLNGNSISEIISKLDHDLKLMLVDQNYIYPTEHHIFQYDSDIDMVKINVPAIREVENEISVRKIIGWVISPKFGSILGISRVRMAVPIPNTPPRLPNQFEFILIYGDMVECSHIGSQQVSLLDVIPVGDVYCKNSGSLIYKKVNKTIIDSISIKMCDNYGRPLLIEDDVFIILHFRLAQ